MPNGKYWAVLYSCDQFLLSTYFFSQRRKSIPTAAVVITTKPNSDYYRKLIKIVSQRFSFFLYFEIALYFFVTPFMQYYGGGSHKDNFDESQSFVCMLVTSVGFSLRFPCTSCPQLRGVIDGVSSPLYLCLYLYYAFYFDFNVYK